MAKTGTYTLIQSQTLGTANATVTFSSIPSTYTDLVLVSNPSGSSAGGDLWLRWGTGSVLSVGYTGTGLCGTGTAATPSRGIGGNRFYLDISGGVATTPSMFISYFMDYANTTTYKSALVRRSDVSGSEVGIYVGMLNISTAIDTIAVMCSSTFSIGSKFDLYGIEAYK